MLTNSTVSGNTQAGTGGVTVTMTNSLIDDGCARSVTTSNGYNIESPGNTCRFGQPTDQVKVSAEDLKLAELGDNGGDTMTHTLGAGSVAIDVIPADECEVTEDQRSKPRPARDGCDVGAFERQEEDGSDFCKTVCGVCGSGHFGLGERDGSGEACRDPARWARRVIRSAGV